MNCPEFRERLHDQLDRHLAPGPELERHAADCASPECRAEWQDYRLLTRGLAAIPQTNSPLLVERVLAELSAAPLVGKVDRSTDGHSPQRRGSTILNLVTVAGVMVAAVLGLRPGSDVSAPAVSKAVSPTPVSPTEAPSRDAVSSSVQLATRAPGLVADTVRESLEGRGLRDLPVLSPLVSTVQETFRPVGRELGEWVRVFQGEPEPTMDSTGIAVPGRFDIAS